jgi:glycosyltransferase involved in cell wall biosynthesis/lipopolysaccharide biosynthesis glycosyltransferase
MSRPLPLCVLISTDDRYASPGTVAVRSLLDTTHHPGPIRIFVLDWSLSAQVKDRMADAWRDPRVSIEWVVIDSASFADLPRLMPHVSLATYGRLMLGMVLPKDVHRVLYLDCDVLVRGDVAELFSPPIAGVVRAVVNFGLPLIGMVSSRSPLFERLGIPRDAPYFNAGVLVIDLDAWRAERIDERCLDLARRYPTEIGLADQCILNAVLYGRVDWAAPRWNSWGRVRTFRTWNPTGYTAAELDAAIRDPGIIHFVMTPKPWDGRSRTAEAALYRRYAASVLRSDHGALPTVKRIDRASRLVAAVAAPFIGAMRCVQAKHLRIATPQRGATVARLALLELLRAPLRAATDRATETPVKPAKGGERIAVFIPRLCLGGAERASIKLANAFAGETSESTPRRVDLVVRDGSGELIQEVDPRVRIVDLSTGSMGRSILRLARYLRRERPDCLLSHMTHANFCALAAKALAWTPTRVIVVDHSDPVREERSYGWLKRLMTPPLRSLLYPRAAHVVAVSSDLAAALRRRRYLGKAKIETIHNPIVDDALLAAAEQPLPWPWPWPAGDERPVVLAVARLSPEKNLQQLLRAFAALRAQRPCRLLIVGDGPARGELAASAERLELGSDVAFAGAVVNPLPFFKAANVLALTSRFEGLPTVLIEALALGLAVVAVDCPYGPREILASGRFGVLVPPDDDAALVEGLARGLDTPLDPGALALRADAYSTARAVRRYARLMAPRGHAARLPEGHQALP